MRVAHRRRRRCPRAQLLIHRGRRQHDPPTVPPTAVGATMLTKERRGHGHDASGRLAAAFRQRGSRRWPPRSKEARQQPSLGNLGRLEAGLSPAEPGEPFLPTESYSGLVQDYLRLLEYYQSIKNGHGRCSDRCHCYQCRVWDHIQWKQVNFDEVNWQGHAV